MPRLQLVKYINAKTAAVVALSLLASCNAYAFGRTHEYIIHVVKKTGEAAPDVYIKTKLVHGYNQSSTSCITSTSGVCSLKFSAFAPTDTLVSVTLNTKDETISNPPTFTLPAVKNSIFKNDDSIETKLVFDEDAARMEMQLAAERSRKDMEAAAERSRKDMEAAADRSRKEMEAAAQKQLEIRKAKEEMYALEREAKFFCANKEICEKAFALTEIFFSKSSDMKIQTATGTTIETYNPTKVGDIGLRALKVPQKGSSASIILTVTCKDTDSFGRELCIQRKSSIYREFRTFMDGEIQQ